MKKKKKQAVILLGVLAILLAALFALRTVNRRTEEAETKKSGGTKDLCDGHFGYDEDPVSKRNRRDDF